MSLYNADQSQREASSKLGLSRTTYRKALEMDESIKLSTFKVIADYFQQKVQLFFFPENHTPDSTTVATCFRVERDGFDSWKIHLMDMVDEFRHSKDLRILLLPPIRGCSEKLSALLAATTIELCNEVKVPIPDWALKTKPLSRPWFVSEMESLKATTLIESPYGYRSKNIFVQDNFLKRA